MSKPDLPLQLRIERLDSHGRGMAAHGDLGLVCDGALPGEVVRVSEYRQRRRLATALAYTVEQAAEARVPPLCRYFGACGGCQLQHARYDAQLAYKASYLKQSLLEYGDVSPAQWLPTLSDAPFHYRRRVRLGVRMMNTNDVIIGFHRKHRSYLLDVRACPVLEPRLHSLLEPLHELIVQLSVCQRLPKIEMCRGEQEVAVVFRHLQALSENDLTLLRDFADRYAVLVFTQAAGPDSVRPLLGEQATALQYSFPEHRIRLTHAPTDFVQANARVNQLLMEAVLQQLDVQEQDTVLDLFCGIGNFSLPMARYARSVTGVEAHPSLVTQAQSNAACNGIHNIRFLQADLTTWIPDLPYNKVLVDPPREGAIDVIKRLPEHGIETIVYVSCLPRTLARDARYLVHHRGFTLSKAGVVDMFPQTKHVEVIAVFQR